MRGRITLKWGIVPFIYSWSTYCSCPSNIKCVFFSPWSNICYPPLSTEYLKVRCEYKWALWKIHSQSYFVKFLCEMSSWHFWSEQFRGSVWCRFESLLLDVVQNLKHEHENIKSSSFINGMMVMCSAVSCHLCLFRYSYIRVLERLVLVMIMCGFSNLHEIQQPKTAVISWNHMVRF